MPFIQKIIGEIVELRLVFKVYQNLSMPFKAGVEGILLSCVGSSGQTRNGSRGHQYPNETLAERSLVYLLVLAALSKDFVRNLSVIVP